MPYDLYMRAAGGTETRLDRDQNSIRFWEAKGGKKRPRLAGWQLQVHASESDGLHVNGLNCCARASSSACSIKKPVRPPLSSSASSKAASRCPISSPRFCAESIISDLHPFSAC